MVKIYTLPPIPIEEQLFYNAGVSWDGGLTSGGAQVVMPEPGGLSTLEIKPSLQDTEWVDPVMSWIMSKTNGQIIRVKLANSPQVSWSLRRNDHLGYNWSMPDMCDNDAKAKFVANSPKGSVAVTVDMSHLGRLLRQGHVIGHEFDCYLIDEISYSGDIATITTTPPIRRNIVAGDDCLLNPWFTGRIQQGAQFRSTYNHLGHIVLGTIIFNEAII